MPIQFINLDDSFPVEDDSHSANTTGTIRFIDASDANRLEAMQRQTGDFINRSILIEEKLNEVINAVNTTPGLVDNDAFVLVDGSNPLTQPLIGVDPVLEKHLATKGYVDAGDQLQNQNMATLSLQIALIQSKLVTVHASDWITHTWNAGNGVKATFAVQPSGIELDEVLALHLFEKTNVHTVANPRWVYRQAVLGGAFSVDDMLVRGSDRSSVEVYIPNEVNLPDYGDSSLLNVVERLLKVVVITGQPCGVNESSSSSSSESSESTSSSSSSSESSSTESSSESSSST